MWCWFQEGVGAMATEPRIESRREQPYLGIRSSVPMEGIAGFIDESYPELFAHLRTLGVEAAGPPFLRYHIIDMDRLLDIETGVPVATSMPGGRNGGPAASTPSVRRCANNSG
jgi:hypothetical protein